MFLSFIFLFTLITYICLYFCKKYNFLLDIKTEKHKRFTSIQKNYSIGGILILIYFCFYFFKENNFIYILFFSLIFIIGLLSDLKIFNDPNKRFIFQALVIFIFIYLLDLKIEQTRFIFLDLLLGNFYFNQLFTIFCLMILINGSNFIDGINTLLINYNIFLYSILLIFFEHMLPDKVILQYLILVLLILLLFNFNGKIIMGDSGSYLLSLFTGTYLIVFASQNSSISPFFVVLLLWYPCYELLFSMIRRAIMKKDANKADVFHLHQMLFKVIKIKSKNKNNTSHFIASTLINIYSSLTILYAIQYSTYTDKIIYIISINIFVYSIFYIYLKKKLKTY